MMTHGEKQRALDYLYPQGGCTVVEGQIVKVPGGQIPSEAELQAALDAANEEARIAEIEQAASAHIAASLPPNKQAENLMLAVLALYQDMDSGNRLSQSTRNAMAPLLGVASKVRAVHAERDRLKANPGLTKADAAFPEL